MQFLFDDIFIKVSMVLVVRKMIGTLNIHAVLIS